MKKPLTIQSGALSLLARLATVNASHTSEVSIAKNLEKRKLYHLRRRERLPLHLVASRFSVDISATLKTRFSPC